MPHKSISVVVPAFNAENHIRHCLQSLVSLDYPSDRLEIIVVDNGSSDRTADIIGEFPVDLVVETEPGASAARNAGVARAQGEIIAFTDSDCVVEPDWAQAIDGAFDDATTDAVMGFTRGIDANIWAELEQENWEQFWFVKIGPDLALRRQGMDTRNAAIRKSVFESCGGFNAALRFCEDLELSARLRAASRKIALCESMAAHHLNRTDLRRILDLKSRHGMAYAEIVKMQTGFLASPHLPVDCRRYLWIDNETARARGGTYAKAVLRLLQAILVCPLRCLVALGGQPRGPVLKLFKTVCAIQWECALLDSLRDISR